MLLQDKTKWCLPDEEVLAGGGGGGPRDSILGPNMLNWEYGLEEGAGGGGGIANISSINADKAIELHFLLNILVY